VQIRVNHHVLDDRRRRAEMAEIVHHQEREAADDPAVLLGHVERVGRVGGESREDGLGQLDR
jgi:hypothetical protein